MNPTEVFADLAPLPRWVTFLLKRKPDGDKYDKVPHDGNRSLSTVQPEHWCELDAALTTAAKDARLDGVGLVMTDGITIDGHRLLGIDMDRVTNNASWAKSLNTYCETSPSGKGLRLFVWVPEEWAEKYQDNGDAKLPGCEHSELYLGSAGRFLTVTFKATNSLGIRRLETEDDLSLIQPFMKKYEAKAFVAPFTEQGTPVDISGYRLNAAQKDMLAGNTPVGIRSEIVHGLLLALLEQGASREDVYATVLANDVLWGYCMYHRSEDSDKAQEFALYEVNSAWGRTTHARMAALASYHEAWGEAQPVELTEPAETPASAKAETPADEDFPPPFPGVMAEAVAAALRVAPKPQPELTILAVLVAMAAGCGSYYRLPGGGRCNLYACGIAETGAGKDLPLRAARELAPLAGARVIGKPASGAGLEDALLSHIGLLCEIDELGHLFAAMNASRAPSYLIELAGILLRLFTASAGTYHRRVRADETKVRSVQCPAVNVLGFATPERLGDAITVVNVTEGLLGRFLFGFGDAEVRPRLMRAPLALPESVGQLGLMVGALSRMTHDGKEIKVFDGMEITMSAEAEKLEEVLLLDFDRRARSDASPLAKALRQRSFEKCERIAGVLAVWDAPHAPQITTGHLTWAAQLVRASDATLLRFAADYMHKGTVQKDAALVRDLVQRIVEKKLAVAPRKGEGLMLQEGWAPKASVLRHSKLDKKNFDDALAHLDACGEVELQSFEFEHANGRKERALGIRVTEA